MSEENVEILHRIVDAWNRQDVEELLLLIDPEAEYVNAPSAVEPGTRRGHEGLLSVARTQWESLPGARQEIDRLHDRGDEIISEGHISRRMPGSDARIGNEILVSWRFREGKVTRIEMLGAGTEFRRALEAAGLSEQVPPQCTSLQRPAGDSPLCMESGGFKRGHPRLGSADTILSAKHRCKTGAAPP